MGDLKLVRRKRRPDGNGVHVGKESVSLDGDVLQVDMAGFSIMQLELQLDPSHEQAP